MAQILVGPKTEANTVKPRSRVYTPKQHTPHYKFTSEHSTTSIAFSDVNIQVCIVD